MNLTNLHDLLKDLSPIIGGFLDLIKTILQFFFRKNQHPPKGALNSNSFDIKAQTVNIANTVNYNILPPTGWVTMATAVTMSHNFGSITPVAIIVLGLQQSPQATVAQSEDPVSNQETARAVEKDS